MNLTLSAGARLEELRWLTPNRVSFSHLAENGIVGTMSPISDNIDAADSPTAGTLAPLSKRRPAARGAPSHLCEVANHHI